jgi:putative toxin-antitoxin system antitoxin component (TIGR02293 family)
MTTTKAMAPSNNFNQLNERLVRQAEDANSSSGVWAAIGIPRRGALLFSGLEQGFNYSTVEALAVFGVNRKELCMFTGITLSTLDRRKSVGHLNTQESDKVYGLVRLIDAATDLFSGNENKAKAWIRKSAKGLGDRAPIDMIRTTAETESVIDFIGRIKHGVIV